MEYVRRTIDSAEIGNSKDEQALLNKVKSIVYKGICAYNDALEEVNNQ